MSMFIHGIGDAGAEGECCTTIRCRYSKTKPRADFWHRQDRRWVCMTCAQLENRRALQMGYNKQCISGKEHLMNILKS